MHMTAKANLKEFENYILQLKPQHPKGSKPFNIERVRYILGLIGNPHVYKEKKYIHITGTSGKGSVAYTTAKTLSNLSYRVGVFTSPHVTSIIERIQVNGRYISVSSIMRIYKRIKPIIEHIRYNKPTYTPSFFDVLLIIAFVYFKESKCVFIVLEAGIGGTHDSTNIIKNPLVTAITNIGIDHTEFLGKTKEKIATDKSGIIKKGSSFFTSELNPKMLTIFRNVCTRMNVPMFNTNINSNIKVAASFHEENCELSRSICAYIAPTKVEYIDEAIHAYLLKPEMLEIPARFEKLQDKPIIIIDGAHNPSKIKSVLSKIETLMSTKRKCIVLIAISADKDAKNILKQIVSIADIIVCTTYSTQRLIFKPEELKHILLNLKYSASNIIVESDSQKAFKTARGIATKNDIVLVTGSFYLASDIRKLYISEEQVLKIRRWK